MHYYVDFVQVARRGKCGSNQKLQSVAEGKVQNAQQKNYSYQVKHDVLKLVHMLDTCIGIIQRVM